MIILLIILGLTFTLSGCSKSDVQNQEIMQNNKAKINIKTTAYVLADLSKRIGGDYVDVINLIPSGISPHDYEPTIKDMTGIMKGDIFLYNGAGLEVWIEKVILNLEGTGVKVVNASRNVDFLEVVDDERSEKGEEDYRYAVDPHVWLNPLNALMQAEEIKNTLKEIDANNAEIYEANFQKLKKEIIDLDREYIEQLKDVKRRDFFVSHAAFGYLAKRYDLEQHSISGIVPEDEPSPTELAEIIKSAKELDINYILVDPKDFTKISEVLADEIGAKIEYIYTIGSLSENELQTGLDYIKLMRKNLEVLKKALNE
ncbi:hypothetical protein BHF71_01970 [Vulcanibacillus modesticaldus]|uniref:ABC transporter substrate-binding protein n=2 Tax=Vulcanibacillus modesticaldus TaxID=337097 RepID=A0A1D2YUT4_9BACI|nr:hypothetical protein BHF71_01970 [Vulcanibacillus modesticaldus]